jgi:nicotinamidase-related amidase
MEAVIVLDMVKHFKNKEHVKKIIPNIKSVLKAAQNANVSVIYVCDMHRPTDKLYFELSKYEPHCLIGTEAGEVIDELKPDKPDLIVRKRNLSGFHATDLEITLRAMGIDRIILAGASTDGCILFTGVDGYQRYFRVTILNDCTSSARGSDWHEWALKLMGSTMNIEVLSSKDALKKYLKRG